MLSTKRTIKKYRLAEILLRVSMFAGLMLAMLTLAATTAATASAADGDPQLPPFANIDKETYLNMRSEHIGLLRGWEPDKPFTSALRNEALDQMQQQLRSNLAQQLETPSLVFNRTWTPIGPAPIPNGQTSPVNPVSGRVTAIVIHPTNPNVVYVGTAQGGVYRTSDGGTTWTPIFDAAKSLAVGALALAPSNPSMLYVGTGEANGSADSYAGVGLYRVDNADTTASLVGPINPIRTYLDAGSVTHNVPVFNGRSISKIVVHPTQPGTVFVGTAGGVIGIGGDTPLGGTIDPLSLGGLWRSTNADGALGSIAFSRIKVSTSNGGFDNPNTGNRSINDIVMDPNDSTGNTLVVWQNGINVVGDGGVWRSTNAMAVDPTTVVFTQTFITTATSTSNGRAVLASYDAGANTVIYAATGEVSTGSVRRSIDGGQTWTLLAGGGGFCGGQCFYDIALAVVGGASTATDRIHLGGSTNSAPERIHGRSLDGGATFVNSDAGLHVDVHAMAVAPSDPTQVWHGNDGGIWKSTDSGANWTSMNNSQFNATQFQSIALHPIDPNFSIGGTQDNGTNMYQPAATWNRIDFGDGGFAAIDQNAADNINVTMYHTYFNQTNYLIGFARILSTACAFDVSGTGVLGWSFKGRYGGVAPDPTPNCDSTDTFNGISLSDPVLFYAPMELGPGNPNTVYFGAGAVYRSTNKGETMPAVSQSSTSPVSAIAVSPQDDNYRIFGRKDGSIFYTTTGANPMTVLSGIPAKFVARAKFDPLNKNTAYIALGGYFGGTTAAQSHVWKVTNLNTTPVLTGINNGLPDVPVNAFAVDPADSNNLFAGTDIGVYASGDAGATWAPFGTGLPAVAVFDMAIQNPNGILRIATHGRGMWQLSIAAPAVIYVSKDGLCNGHNPCWPNIQNGISSASAASIIKTTQETYNEAVILDFNELIILQGGWDTNFASRLSYTTIQGSITITHGMMIIENIILQ